MVVTHGVMVHLVTFQPCDNYQMTRSVHGMGTSSVHVDPTRPTRLPLASYPRRVPCPFNPVPCPYEYISVRVPFSYDTLILISYPSVPYGSITLVPISYTLVPSIYEYEYEIREFRTRTGIIVGNMPPSTVQQFNSSTGTRTNRIPVP